MRRHHSLRASDADRDAVVDRLRDAAGEGRLEPDELEQRVDVALRARTYGDLDELLADLPGDGLARRPGPRTGSIARVAVLGAGLLIAVTVAVAVVALVAMLVLTAAAWWIACVLFWLVCCGSRRRLAWGPPGRRSMSGHRTRPAGLL
jgi:uncharacterized protein DUF1707